MKFLIINNRTITTSLFLKNLVELNQQNKYKFIDQYNYIIFDVKDLFNFKRCHDYFLESICLFFGNTYENPTLPTAPKKRSYNKQYI
jgi:hypothetical protein